MSLFTDDTVPRTYYRHVSISGNHDGDTYLSLALEVALIGKRTFYPLRMRKVTLLLTYRGYSFIN